MSHRAQPDDFLISLLSLRSYSKFPVSGLFSQISQIELMFIYLFIHNLIIFFEMEFHSYCPGWGAMAPSWLTATFAFQVQAILLL